MKIVSCEDDMTHHPYGVFNISCTITSFIIMILPLHCLRRVKMMRKNYNEHQQQQHQQQQQQQQRDEDNTKLKSSSLTLMEHLSMYSIALSLLFTFNLYEHMTGYTGPPSIDSFGLVSNTVLCALLYELWWIKHCREVEEYRQSIKDNHGDNDNGLNLSDYDDYDNDDSLFTSPKMVTVNLYFLSILFMSIGFITSNEEEEDAQWKKWEKIVTEPFSIPINLYVIYATGKLCWMYSTDFSNVQRYRSLFHYWKRACIFLVLTGVGVKLEPVVCSLLDESHSLIQTVISRGYHSIILHIIIASLFYYISEAVFRMVEIELNVPEEEGGDKVKQS